MGFTKFIEIGRVCQVARGKLENKLVVVLDIVNLNRVLVEGEEVARCVIPVRHLVLTDQKVKILRGVKTGILKKAIQKENVKATFDKSSRAVKQARQAKRANLSDFQRFQAMVLKRKVATLLKNKLNKQ